jgi:ribonuclease E
MANKMLIDATHPEETRVVVVRGNRVEEFDFESASRRQLRGNIYLAKVTRVEPSLQAAFVDYGGNRHGFLAFSEIHPDYYQIPVADRQALIAEEERAHRDAEAEADRRAGMRHQHPRHRRANHRRSDETVTREPSEAAGSEPQPWDHGSPPADFTSEHEHHAGETHEASAPHESQEGAPEASHEGAADHTHHDHTAESEAHDTESARGDETVALAATEMAPGVRDEASAASEEQSDDESREEELADDSYADEVSDEESAEAEAVEVEAREAAVVPSDEEGNGEATEEEDIVESVGGADAMEEVPDRAPRFRRQYKIQEVIKRRQIMLVQVVKEERGTKGAALTTYLSLAGRYSVLMPNTARGGGISRKITNVQDRKRLKEIAQDLEVPEGMGVILRTAGAARTKTEVKRDFEYLLRAWETVRDLTLKSTAPTLVYEEGSLVKRSIRDLYNKDIDEVIVAGEDAYRDARDFMRMLMPTHAKNVKLYPESQPLFTRYGIESQLDAMFSPVVQLRSGGYIVLNQAEALVAIDVNSGRATREHHIEDTALKTNLEASEEIARQLRLRDLAGLIVIDFIDMDEKRNNRSVERRLKECLKNDRARIQVGRISHFGLLEMSRQRIRTSVLESSTDKCPHCGGTGHVRSVASVALQCLRMIEETLQRGATHNIILRTRSEIALYVLNQKRSHLSDLEQRFQIAVTVTADPTISGQLPFAIERGEQVHSLDQARTIVAQSARPITIPITEHEAEAEETEEAEELEEGIDEDEEEEAEALEAEGVEPGEREGESEEEVAEASGERSDNGRRRRRRRRRGRREPREGGYVAGEGRQRQAERQGGQEGGQEGEREGEQEGEFTEGESFVESDEHAEANGEAVEGSGEAEPRSTRGDGNGDARRRRRRGRRGGRRGRREEGEGAYRPPEHDVPPIDEEVAHAVADFGGPPAEALPHEAVEHGRTRHRPADEINGAPSARPTAAEDFETARSEREPAMPPPEAAKPEAPKRRSTVREPAPSLGSGVSPPVEPPIPPPPATEVGAASAEAPESAASAPGAPRRAGWWAKRILGGKS